ncbi:hypothetical protein CsSME_00035554 [Camellia sinensis var. sinensis]
MEVIAESDKDQLRVKKEALEAVLLQCQRALELLTNTGFVDDADTDAAAADDGDGSSPPCRDKETDEVSEFWGNSSGLIVFVRILIQLEFLYLIMLHCPIAEINSAFE